MESQNKFETRTLDNKNNNMMQPVVHRPCSATLGKFHDSVNYSFVVEGGSNKLNSSKTQQQLNLDAKANAREKYKYMTRTKTYVDESLFGGATSNQHLKHEYSNSSHHLSHSQMSHISPLIHNAPIQSARPQTGRVEMSHINELINNNNLITNDARQSAKARAKPWKP